jgi:hypothetical protein
MGETNATYPPIVAAIAVAIAIVALAAGPANAHPIGATIFNPASERCVGISNGLAGIWDCTGNADQMWHKFPVSGSVDQLTNLNGYRQVQQQGRRGGFLGVAGGATNNGARVVQWYQDYTANQQWLFLENPQ